MIIEHLDLETRNRIYNHTKKVLRKYQKGIITGKLTADKFADNILSNESITDIINEEILSQPDFKDSYISYIQTLINIQNKDLSKNKRKKTVTAPTKPSITQKIQLKNILDSSQFILDMPLEYLTAEDVDAIIQYINDGSIDIGNEKIYKYVHKPDFIQ